MSLLVSTLCRTVVLKITTARFGHDASQKMTTTFHTQQTFQRQIFESHMQVEPDVIVMPDPCRMYDFPAAVFVNEPETLPINAIFCVLLLLHCHSVDKIKYTNCGQNGM